MSAPQSRLQPVRNAALPDTATPEQRYWRSYKAPLLIKENNAIDHIHFNPVTGDLAFTSSTRIQILNARTQQIEKTIARFKDTVYSGEFRFDGKLLVAGDATGLIQAFNVQNRSVLVTLKPTKHPVHVTKFHPTSQSTLLSASDDRIVRLWDLTTSVPLSEFTQHDDYVRAAGFAGNASSLVVSGCYDGYVRLWDPRVDSTQGPIIKFKQGEPVDSVLSLNDTTIVSSGGPVIQSWDITAGKKIKSLTNFQKTVTCLAPAGDKGFLAGSLDGHVKVINHNDPSYSVLYGWKFGGPVLSTGMSANLDRLATGLTTGLMSVRTRQTSKNSAAATKTKAAKTGNFARMIRGAEYKGELETQIYETTNKPQSESSTRLKAYEKHVRAFKWSDALDSAFTSGVSPEQAMMVLSELRSRGKIQISLAGRDEDGLEPLLKWCVKHVHDVRCVSLITDWMGVVLDLYSPLVEKSGVLGNLVNQLHNRVNAQTNHASDASRIEGMLRLLMA